jgi:hypothetical protein
MPLRAGAASFVAAFLSPGRRTLVLAQLGRGSVDLGFMTTPPSDWCDRRCERCPLVAECPSLSGVPASSGPSADALGGLDAALERAADAALAGLGEVLDARERGALVEPFEGMVAATAFVVRRARRLAAHGAVALRRSGGGPLDWDTCASVVVLDRSLAALRRSVEGLRPAEHAAALAAGLGALAPEVARWNARVSDAFRIALGAHIREGTAPSPFCTTDH